MTEKRTHVRRLFAINEVDDNVKNSESNKINNKKCHFCIYCKKLIANFARHLTTVHIEEPEVTKIISYPPGNNHRKKEIDKIRKEGDFIYNRENVEKLITVRHSRKAINKNKTFICCFKCKGYYSKSSLRKHYKTCNTDYITPFSKTTIAMGRSIQSQIHKEACEKLKHQIFPYLRSDDVTAHIQYDEITILYGNELCNKYRSSHHDKMIRARLRAVGRFLIEIKKLTPIIKEMKDIFQARYCESVVNAIHKLGRIKNDGKYEAPATAADTRNMILKCADILDRQCLIHHERNRRQDISDFLTLFKASFAASVTTSVKESKLLKQRTQKIILPTIEDIKLLNLFLKKNRRESFINLSEKFSYSTWVDLASYTLISVQIFNRRRPGETERFTIADYNTFETVIEDDIYKSMSVEAKKLTKLFGRCSLRGKLGRTVSIIISAELKQCIDLILKYRKNAGVPETNTFVFGVNSEDGRLKHLNACDLMRKFSIACKAKNPDVLRATKLRKHIATHSISMELEENDVRNLADFMGHADKIHKTYYRLPLVARDITVISKYLLNAQGDNFLGNEDNSDFESNHEDMEYQDLNLTEEDILEPENQKDKEEMGQVLNCFTKEGTEYQTYNENSKISNPCNKKLIVCLERMREDVIASKGYLTTPLNTPPGTPKKIARCTWTTPETKVMKQAFKQHLFKKSLPSDRLCKDVLGKFEELRKRSVPMLKAWVNNYINREKRMQTNPPKKETWTTPERQIMRRIFYRHIESKILPTIDECEEVTEKNKILRKRSAVKLKSWIHNEIKRRSK